MTSEDGERPNDEKPSSQSARERRPPDTPSNGMRAALLTIGRVVLAPFVFIINVVAALVVLFEEWGWRPLSRFMAWLATFSPWASVERWISGLPPYAALAVFALPSVMLFPLKFVALWLIAQGKLISASALFVAGKMASTAWIARVFMLTQPTLMRISWFARAYTFFMPWKERLFAIIRASWVWRYGRMIKARLRQMARRVFARWRPEINRVWLMLRQRARAVWASLRR